MQAVFPTNDAVFDCCWSEVHPEHVRCPCCPAFSTCLTSEAAQVISGGGDGGVRVWDISAAASSPRPILAYLQHQQEVSCVVYNLVSKALL
jgi:WD40 repeat protein